MIDSHCHIQFNAYKDDAEIVIKRCIERGVILNCVGSQINTSRRAVEYAKKYKNIYATIGLHPIHLFSTEVDEGEVAFKTREENFDYEEYKKLANHPKVIGIGECGLELFHLPKDANRDEIIKKQSETFLKQYRLAKELDLPVVIHVREAHDEMINLLKNIGEPIRGVVHCYTGDWSNAQKYLDLGLYIGFTGVITFPAKKTNPKPQEDLIEVVKKCPIDKVLIETDAPYLAPQAYRGQRCEPWMVAEVAKKIAQIRQIDLEEVIKITEDNTKKLFTRIK